MNDRELFIAMLLAAICSGSNDPAGDTMRIFEAFIKLDNKGSIPK